MQAPTKIGGLSIVEIASRKNLRLEQWQHTTVEEMRLELMSKDIRSMLSYLRIWGCRGTPVEFSDADTLQNTKFH